MKKDKAKLQGRLDAGVLEGVAEDVRLLSNQTSSALTVRVQKKAATQKQNEIAEEVAALVMAVRSAVKLTAQETAVRKAAEMQFVVDDPERVAQYKALVPARPKKRKPRPTA